MGGAAALAGAAVTTLAGCSSHVDEDAEFDRLLARAREESPELFQPTKESQDAVLAWGCSYLLEALCLRFVRTHRDDYGDAFVALADRILSLRDTVVGAREWNGATRPVWSVGSRYTVQRAVLGAPGRLRLAEFCAARSTSALTMHTEGSTRSFTLQVRRDKSILEHYEQLSLHSRDDRFVERVLMGASPTPSMLTCSVADPVSARDLLLADGATKFDWYRAAFAVHSGMIAAPIAKFAQSLASAGGRYTGPARRFEAAALAAYRAHADEARREGDRVAMAHSKGVPVPFDGNFLPHNQTLAYARLGLYLGPSATCEERQRSVEMVKTFAADVSLVDGALAWSYWPTFSRVYTGYEVGDGVSRYTPRAPASTAREDASHGTVDVLAADAALSQSVDLGRLTTTSLRRSAQRLNRGTAADRAVWSLAMSPSERPRFSTRNSHKITGQDLLAAAITAR